MFCWSYTLPKKSSQQCNKRSIGFPSLTTNYRQFRNIHHLPRLQISRKCFTSTDMQWLKWYDTNGVAIGCVNRWISSDHITWMMKTLTEYQNDTYCIFLKGALNTDPKTYRRFRHGNANFLSKFIFALNVGWNERGTFLGGDDKRVCDWTYVISISWQRKLCTGIPLPGLFQVVCCAG